MSDGQTIIDEANRKEQLIKLSKNLNILLERKAKYGEFPPLDLANQIDDHRKAIDYIKQFLNGNLSNANLDEALEPLLLAINNGQVVNVKISTNIYNAIPKTLIVSIFLITIAVVFIAVAIVSGYNLKMLQSEIKDDNGVTPSPDFITATFNNTSTSITQAISITNISDPSIPTPTPVQFPNLLRILNDLSLMRHY